MPNILGWVSSALSGLPGKVAGFVTSIPGKLKNAFTFKMPNILGWVSHAISGLPGKVWNMIKSIPGKLKDAFTFSLPHIKLPHFSLKGKFSLNPPSIPTVGIKWYAKAMNDPYVLDNATIFGKAGGSFLGGGEAGREIVYSHDRLLSDIANASGAAILSRIDQKLDQIAAKSTDIYLDKNTLVGGLISKIDSELGFRYATRIKR